MDNDNENVTSFLKIKLLKEGGGREGELKVTWRSGEMGGGIYGMISLASAATALHKEKGCVVCVSKYEGRGGINI